MNADTFGRNLFASWIGVIVVLLVWQFIAAAQLINPSVFPGPLEVLEDASRVTLGELGGHIRASLTRVFLGFSIGTALGVSIGVATGWYRWLGRIVWSPLELLRPIPPLAWIPLALIWFGLGENSKIFIIFLGAFFPIVTNTYKGMLSIDPALMRAAQTLGLSGWKLLIRVAIPATLPDIATGMRVGWSLSFGSLVAAEIIAANEGLGYMIMHARETGAGVGVIIYGIIIIGILNLITDYLFSEIILKRQLNWHFSSQ